MKRKFFYTEFIIVIVILVLGSYFQTKAQGYGDRTRLGGDGNYAIQGKLLLPTGKPATGIRVSLSSADYIGSSATTDNDGNFRFNTIPAGNYSVTIKGTESFDSDNEAITIERDSPSGQNFNIGTVFLRLPGQKKGDLSNNPMFAGVPKSALEKYQSAMEKISKNDAKNGLRLFDEAVAAYPNFAIAYYEKGNALLKQNELNPALEAFTKAIQIKADFFDAKLNYGYTLFLLKDYQDSANVFRDLLREKTDSPLVYLYAGMALLGLKQYDNAETAFKKVLTIKGGENMPSAHRYLGGIYMQKKQNAEAIAELQKYLELDPKAADTEKIKSLIADLKKQN